MPISISIMGVLSNTPSRIEIEPEQLCGLTLGELISQHLAPRYGADFAEALCDAGGLRQDYTVLVNGRNAAQLGGLDLIVEDRASVVITPIVSGG